MKSDSYVIMTATTSTAEVENSDCQDEDDLPALLKAAKEGNPATFKKLLLEEDTNILIKDRDDRTALHWAARSGCVPIILTGVGKGLAWYIDAKTKRHITPLHDACLAGHRKVVHLLIALGADLTAQTQEGYTPLLCAAGSGYSDVTRILIGAGCDGNKLIQPMGVNALHLAAWTGQNDVIDILLELGCRVNEQSKAGKTALDYAIQQRHSDCMEILNNYIKEMESLTVDDNKVIKSRMRRMESKIRDLYGTKLHQEIAYFEKQLQEQHERDLGIIANLQEEIKRLHLIIGDSRSGRVVGNRRRSRSTADMATIGQGENRLLTNRQGGQTRLLRPPSSVSSTSESSDKTGFSENSDFDDDDDIAFDRSQNSGTISPRIRSASGQDKTIKELIEEDPRKRATKAVLKRQLSAEGGLNFATPPSQRKNFSLLPDKPAMSPQIQRKELLKRQGSASSLLAERQGSSSPQPCQRILTPTPPKSPSPREQGSQISPRSPVRKSSDQTFSVNSNSEQTPKSRRKGVSQTQQPSLAPSNGKSRPPVTPYHSPESSPRELPSAPPAPPAEAFEQQKTRRRSISDIIFPFKRAGGEEKLFKRRHQSVVTKAPVSPPAAEKSPTKGFSLFQAPLPGIRYLEPKEL